MHRVLLIGLLALAGAAPAAHAATAKARLAGCVTSLDRVQRTASFTGDIRSIPGASRLQVRFVLQARTDDEPAWSTVAAPGLGTWNSSVPGIARYVFTKTVENLLAPASYRAQVHFRWLSPAGRTLLQARRRTKVCRQPDLRPDLVVDGLTRTPSGYDASISNAGRTAAERFLVTIEIDGQLHRLGYVERLGAGERASLRGQAPECRPGSPLIARVDADGAVKEIHEEANSLEVLC